MRLVIAAYDVSLAVLDVSPLMRHARIASAIVWLVWGVVGRVFSATQERHLTVLARACVRGPS